MLARSIVIALALVACSKSSDETTKKQWQSTPPPAQKMTIPDGVAISVDVDGAAKPAITSDTLKATRPDFVDAEHQAWLVATLVPDAAPGAVVEAVAPSGVGVKFARPTPDGLEPVLFLTRRGELTARAVDPKDPFPKWEGQGGRLHRPGDTLPHVAVARLAITKPTH